MPAPSPWHEMNSREPLAQLHGLTNFSFWNHFSEEGKTKYIKQTNGNITNPITARGKGNKEKYDRVGLWQ